MSEMETDSQIPVDDCSKKRRICSEINGHSMLAGNYQDLCKTPDTAENYEMKEVLRAALKETLQKKSDLCVVSELRSRPPCTFFNCPCDAETAKILKNEPSTEKANQDSPNSTETFTTPKNDKDKTKNKNKKCKIKKDSSEDFAFPKRTARPVSPLVSEPIAVSNSFSDLESENEHAQVVQWNQIK
ncbi:hypothetical protein TNIN_457991 [Trichonephila inaurata madagascariensis]|uniref:Uncharacterized protein n=1 Tax=Trichonephila inaurata madagascariensis TaxID=2747483 RepID=A0A8X6XKT2_9ARAC|nr:hypothetical protein TNIN_457991 [Trichonephila inaurata madagascariensis]